MKRKIVRRPGAACFSLRIALVLALAGSAAAFAQAPRPGAKLDDAPTFGERIDVRVVNVEVVVTDRQGNRVHDLTPQDFRLRVDGKEVLLQYFSEVREGQAVAPAPAEAAGTGANGANGAKAPAEPPSLVAGKAVGTSYLVFVDDFFSYAAQRNIVLGSIRDQVARLGPDDRMAIVAYDGRKLTMLSSWSSSPRELAHALARAMDRPAYGTRRAAELRLRPWVPPTRSSTRSPPRSTSTRSATRASSRSRWSGRPPRRPPPCGPSPSRPAAR
jgi:VWFA-related protein